MLKQRMAAFRFVRFLPCSRFLRPGSRSAWLPLPPNKSRLQARPEGVDYTILCGEVASCTIELEETGKAANGKATTAWSSGTPRRDPRKFHDSTGNGGVNMFAYYKDGEEATARWTRRARARSTSTAGSGRTAARGGHDFATARSTTGW